MIKFLKPQIIQDWDVNAVATSFAKAATQYDAAARLQREVGRMLFNKLNNSLSANQTVLDIGAGTGYCTELLAAHNANVVALDIAPAMLVQARRRLGENAKYLAADAQLLPLKDHSVDIVFANLVLQWCVDLSVVFREFKRVLKTMGKSFSVHWAQKPYGNFEALGRRLIHTAMSMNLLI